MEEREQSRNIVAQEAGWMGVYFTEIRIQEFSFRYIELTYLWNIFMDFPSCTQILPTFLGVSLCIQ